MKTCHLLLVLGLICLFLVGCGNAGSSELSAEVKAEMDVAWQRQKGEKLQWDGVSGYYGTYGGVVVYIVSGDDGAIGKRVVAGEVFSWPSSFVIYAYKDGDFYDLEMAYEKGVLTKKNIESIAERHDEYLSERTNWGDYRP